MRVYLIDNGSFRAASYLNLRRIAAALSERLGVTVLPTSLLHSRKIPAEELDGIPALTWERQMKKDLEAGERDFRILPLFIGPTGAIIDYLPERLKLLRESYGDFKLEVAPFLYQGTGSEGRDFLGLIRQRIRDGLNTFEGDKPNLVFVDHGSPRKEVAAVRDEITEYFAAEFKDQVRRVIASSMESREGPEYAFNQPLLEDVLRRPEMTENKTLIVMLFLGPGRHAGAEGDVAMICEEAEKANPGLDFRQTELLATDDAIVDVLEARYGAFPGGFSF